MEQFKLKNSTKQGQCDANRCNEAFVTVYGSGAKLCARHVGMLTDKETEELGVIQTAEQKETAESEAIQARLTPIAADAKSMAEQFEAMVIENDDVAESAAEVIREIHDQHKELEAERKSVVGPLNKAVKKINGWFKPATKALDEAKATLKGKIEAYQQEKEVARLAAFDEGRIEDALEMAPPVVPNGMAQRKVWGFDVVDIDLVPAQYMMVNEALITAAIKNTDPETLNIPGIAISQKNFLVMSRSKP